MKKSTIKSFLLLALLLMGAGSSWADGYKQMTLFSQDYSSYSVGWVKNTTTAADWTSSLKAYVKNYTADPNNYIGYCVQFYSTATSGKSAYNNQMPLKYTAGSGYNAESTSAKGYIVEFDFLINGGNASGSNSQMIVAGSDPSAYSSPYAGTDYLFSLSQTTSSAAQSTTWYINDLGNSTGTSVELDGGTYYHLKLVVNETSISYVLSKVTIDSEGNGSLSTIKDVNGNDVSGSLTASSMPSIGGIYALLGKNLSSKSYTSKMNFDNFNIYEYVPVSKVTIPANKNYATYTPTENDVEFSGTGITAYEATYPGSGSTVTLSKVTHATKGQGVLLKREDQTSTDAVSSDIYQFTNTNNFTLSTDNVLKGVTSDMNAAAIIAAAGTDKTPYVLQDGTWYKVVDGTSQNSLTAGKAYLAITKTGAANSLSMDFGDGVVTGINEVSAEKVSAQKIYNLQGMEVKNTEKGGLYIVNGKKVVF